MYVLFLRSHCHFFLGVVRRCGCAWVAMNQAKDNQSRTMSKVEMSYTDVAEGHLVFTCELCSTATATVTVTVTRVL